LPEREEPPPIFASWRALYALVIIGLLVMIGVCAAITRWGTR
jgi:hypothetical protein